MADLTKNRKQNVLCAKINFRSDIDNMRQVLSRMISSLSQYYNENREETFDNGRWGLLDIQVGDYTDYIVGRLFRYKREEIPKKGRNQTLDSIVIDDKVSYSNFLFDRDSQIIAFEYSNNISENQFIQKIQLIINSITSDIPAYDINIYENIETFREKVSRIREVKDINFSLRNPNNPPDYIDRLENVLSGTLEETNAAKLSIDLESKPDESLNFSGELIEMAISMVERTYGTARVCGFSSQNEYVEVNSQDVYFQRNIRTNDLIQNVKESYYEVIRELIRILNR